MYERLIKLGWVCSPCACPGKKGYDCMHKDHPDVLIKINETFKILNKSMVIESGFGYQLEAKMRKHDLIK